MSEILAEEVAALRRRTELLAPAGRRDVLEAVINAGADAVYISGKRFQMRAHRPDFHFDDAALVDAVQYAHARGRRVYVTVNALLAEHELEDARAFLVFLQEAGADAAIVCDLAMIATARELGVGYELHASTMMNVHDAEQACFLKEMGVCRVVTSRDISIGDAASIGEASGLDVEYFLHGDMCVAQSGQCTMSGVALGKSSNRGECMKPCRWQYELVRDGGAGGALCQGHLMAIRDLSLIRQIPELIEAGICALKIEGRMREAPYLQSLVGVYREALDLYHAYPGGYAAPQDAIERLQRLRVRELSSLTATGAPSSGAFFDITGKREPLILSNGAVEPDMTRPDFEFPEFEASFAPDPESRRCPELAVCVASPQAAESALDAGVDRVYLAAETDQKGGQQWTVASFSRAVEMVRERGAALGLQLPRVSTKRTRAEWAVMTGLCRGVSPQYLLAHHFGDMRRARAHFPDSAIIADYGFNVLNSIAARVLLEQGAALVTPSQEAGYEDVAALASTNVIPMELVVHGPVTGMLMEHCIIGLNLGQGASKDECRGMCRHASFALRDLKGETRDIVTDQYCRNHLLTAKDIALLPLLDPFLRLGPSSVRIEGQFYAPELVGRLADVYRRALNAWQSGGVHIAPPRGEWEPLCAASPRPWNLGAYARHVTRLEPVPELKGAAR